MSKKYIIFDTQQEVSEANGRWLYELYKNKELLKNRKERKNSKKYTAFDFGSKLKNGKYAIRIPKKYKNVLKGKTKTVLETDFVGGVYG